MNRFQNARRAEGNLETSETGEKEEADQGRRPDFRLRPEPGVLSPEMRSTWRRGC